MREWCGCGAAFHSLSKRAVKDWRTNHCHDGKPDPEPEKQGTTSQAETAWRPPFTDNGSSIVPDINARRIGFSA